jgi:hypothetical protein
MAAPQVQVFAINDQAVSELTASDSAPPVAVPQAASSAPAVSSAPISAAAVSVVLGNDESDDGDDSLDRLVD